MNEVIEKPSSAAPVQHAERNDFFLAIAEAAANPAIDAVKLEKLMDLHERALNRNARMAFAAALAAMQHEIPSIEENGAIVTEKGGKPRSLYATFEDINDAVRPVLQKYGFAISFRIKQLDAHIEITAILSHREGHAEETSMRMPADSSGSKNAVQAMGSTVSYGKRYTMMALLNITSRAPNDRDDDARAGGSVGGIVRNEQAVEIDTLMRETKTNKAKFLALFNAESIETILAKDYKEAMRILNERKQEKAHASA